MNEPGRLIYKCRRCNKIRDNTHVPDGPMTMTCAVTGSMLSYEPVRILEVCNCKDGGLGIADLVGFEPDTSLKSNVTTKETNMFDINSLYTYRIILYPQDNHKYGKKKIDISGLIIADSERSALEKVYEHCGIEFGKTICLPNVRQFTTEQLPYFRKNGMLTTGFSEMETDEVIQNE